MHEKFGKVVIRVIFEISESRQTYYNTSHSSGCQGYNYGSNWCIVLSAAIGV